MYDISVSMYDISGFCCCLHSYIVWRVCIPSIVTPSLHTAHSVVMNVYKHDHHSQ